MQKIDTDKVTRIEIIDHSPKGEGREFVRYYDGPVEVNFDLQDDERTLKIFIKDKE